ncbi:GNAT family N-acetyltransferase [Nocardia sp. BMG51109]|uniref:GNAT family N-acetyltransferase n=1 Tax=Nocardia sp. BMG51109 TaxID=1056816 RepID=UPI000464BF30|nr:GNAT family N-acetyltransferase [Nocardia sp. BMG51109]
MGENQQVSVGLGSVADAGRWLDAVCDIYDQVFSEPPFVWPEGESGRHRAMMDRLIEDPTFGIALARTPDDLVGFVYGVGLKPDGPWWDGFQQPVPDDLVREWDGRTFAVIDLAVQQNWRRRGLGRRLLDVLSSSRPEERATLAVQPQAADSHAFYAAVGEWRSVGRQDTPGYVSSQFDIYVRELVKP